MANEYLVNSADLSAVADAIREKGETTEALAFPEGFVDAVGAIQAGGFDYPAFEKDINFVDYDGTLLYAYAFDEATALTALPVPPEHDELVFDKWNWSIEGIKTQAAAKERTYIGALYTTDDGATHIHIHLEEGRTSPMVGPGVYGGDNVVFVDWGDGSTPDMLSGWSTAAGYFTPTHEYASPGDYIIRISAVQGARYSFYGKAAMNQGSYMLRYTNDNDNRNYAYRNAIKKIHFGDSIFELTSNSMYGLQNLRFVSMPSSLAANAGYTFYNCQSLKCIVLPAGVEPKSSFNNCYALERIVPAEGATMNTSSECYPNCYCLKEAKLSDSQTSIEYGTFLNCYSLTKLVIPENVASLDSSSLSNLYGLKVLRFKPTTPPTAANTGVFSGYPTDCVVYVPAGTLETYQAATNYTNIVDLMQEASE